MGVYKHLIEIEQKVNTFYSKYIIDLTKLVVDVDKLVDDYSNNFEIFSLRDIRISIKSLKDSLFGIKSTFEDIQKMFITTKKDITLKNLEQCVDLMHELEKNLLDSLDFLEKIRVAYTGAVYSSKNIPQDINTLFSNSADSLKKFALKTGSAYNNYVDFSKLFDILSVDKKILHFTRFNKEMFDLKEILGYSHVHTISVKKYIGNKKIIIKFISKIDFDKVTIGKVSASNTVKDLCNLNLQNVTSEIVEKEIFTVKGMTSWQLEMRALELVKNCVLYVLDTHSNMLRDTVPLIQVELLPKDEYLGAYLSEKSNFHKIFIGIYLNNEILDSLASGRGLSIRGTTAETIIHELGHAYDWMLNVSELNTNPNDSKKYFNNNFKSNTYNLLTESNSYLLAKKISGRELPLVRDNDLSKILISLREEGLVVFIESKLKTIIVNLKNNSLMLYPVELVYEEKSEEFRKMLDKNISFDEIYNDGILHKLGKNMAILLFIDTYNTKFDYILKNDFSPVFYETKDNNSAVANRLLKAHNKFGMMDKKKLFSYLGNELFYIIGESNALKRDIDLFISKISIMPPEIFLERYVSACKTYGLSPIITARDWNGNTMNSKDNNKY
ncbi:MAG: hypothetical protein ACP5N1_04020 [Candidatus Woesearchaeota archaeon]